MNQLANKDKSHFIWYGMILSLIGGMMDTYSFVVRGGVFATGQTGNFVLLVLGIANRDLSMVVRAIVPITAFWLGVFAAEHLFHVIAGENASKTVLTKRKGRILLFEAVCMMIIGLIPNSVYDSIPNTLISFIAAMQFCSFRHFEGHRAYASVFVTGNMRSCAEKYYEGFVLKKTESRKIAFQYTYILIGFFAGAYLEVMLARYVGEKAIWSGAVLALICSRII